MFFVVFFFTKTTSQILDRGQNMEIQSMQVTQGLGLSGFLTPPSARRPGLDILIVCCHSDFIHTTGHYPLASASV